MMLAVWMMFLTKSALGAPADEEVISLPGWSGALPSKMYSGYLDVSATKHLHYVLVESQNEPSSDAIAIWFNGGPGCSSLDGFLYEHGPFRFTEYDGTGSPELVAFEYSWSKLATMVYIEQPVGVGFSYSSGNTSVEYECTDDTAAYDNLKAVEALFAKFPEYMGHDFFITGESYAGIYVPTLAQAILQAANYTGAKLTGIAVGNGCSGSEIGICAFTSSTQGSYYITKYLSQQGFAPESLKQELEQVCDWDTWSQGGELTETCSAAVGKLDLLTHDLDTYCIYCDCGQQFPGAKSRHQLLNAPTLKQRIRATAAEDVDPTTACIDSFAASAWLNQPSVQQALHVTQANVSDWAVCATPADWTYTSTRPNLPRDTYPLLVENINVLIYNGDWDACVPYTDNEGWTSSMGYNISSAWHPWLFETNGFNSVGGYATKYDVPGSFTFTTVRGGRHEVPETAPERAYAMMQRFFAGSDF